MIIIPQFYMRDSKVVSTEEKKPSLFKDDPFETAHSLKNCGVDAIHIIDLNITAVGTGPHLGIISRIKRELDLGVFVDGAFKTAQAVEAYVNAGAEIVSIGSVAYQQPKFLQEVAKAFPGRIGVHIDVKGGRVTIPGYAVTTNKRALDYAEGFAGTGIKHILFSASEADGHFTQKNVDEIREFCTKTTCRVIITSEIGNLSDIERIVKANSPRIDGIVLAKSIQDERIDLGTAVAFLAELTMSDSTDETLAD